METSETQIKKFFKDFWSLFPKERIYPKEKQFDENIKKMNESLGEITKLDSNEINNAFFNELESHMQKTKQEKNWFNDFQQNIITECIKHLPIEFKISIMDVLMRLKFHYNQPSVLKDAWEKISYDPNSKKSTFNDNPIQSIVKFKGDKKLSDNIKKFIANTIKKLITPKQLQDFSSSKQAPEQLKLLWQEINTLNTESNESTELQGKIGQFSVNLVRGFLEFHILGQTEALYNAIFATQLATGKITKIIELCAELLSDNCLPTLAPIITKLFNNIAEHKQRLNNYKTLSEEQKDTAIQNLNRLTTEIIDFYIRGDQDKFEKHIELTNNIYRLDSKLLLTPNSEIYRICSTVKNTLKFINKPLAQYSNQEVKQIEFYFKMQDARNKTGKKSDNSTFNNDPIQTIFDFVKEQKNLSDDIKKFINTTVEELITSDTMQQLFNNLLLPTTLTSNKQAQQHIEKLFKLIDGLDRKSNQPKTTKEVKDSTKQFKLDILRGIIKFCATGNNTEIKNAISEKNLAIFKQSENGAMWNLICWIVDSLIALSVVGTVYYAVTTGNQRWCPGFYQKPITPELEAEAKELTSLLLCTK